MKDFYTVHLIVKNDSTKRIIVAHSNYSPVEHYKDKAYEINLKFVSQDKEKARKAGEKFSSYYKATIHDLILD